jgi:hypothetical protein
LAKAEALAKAEELEDVEFSGKHYRLPKELKSALMMHADYTRKTQEVADDRRALESERESLDSDREALRQQAEADREHIRDLARVMALEEQIEAYRTVDWDTLEAEDPVGAQRLFRAYSMLKDQREGLAAKIHADEQKRSSEAQQAKARRYADTNAQLAREITDWDEIAPKLIAFAKVNGVSDAEMAEFDTSVPLVKLLRKAWLGDQLIARQKAAAKAAEAKAEPEPLKQIAKGRGTPATSGLSDNLSPEEWVKRRNEQLRKR